MLSNALGPIKVVVFVVPILFLSIMRNSSPQPGGVIETITPFMMHFGYIPGLVLSKYIAKYGKKSAMIFGGTIAAIFGLEAFIAESATTKATMGLFAGFGHAVFCENLASSGTEQTKARKTRIEFVLYHAIEGVTIFILSSKIAIFIEPHKSWLAVLSFVLVATLSKMIFLQSSKKHTSSSAPLWGLMVACWICAISQNAETFYAGCALFSLSAGILEGQKSMVLQNNKIIGVNTVAGFCLAALLIVALSPNISVYTPFVVSVCVLSYSAIWKKISKA